MEERVKKTAKQIITEALMEAENALKQAKEDKDFMATIKLKGLIRKLKEIQAETS